jgi:hypothetical protein
MTLKLKDLEAFFKQATLPKQIKLVDFEVNNVESFVNECIYQLKTNSGNKSYMPYYDKLIEIYTILKT